jgi:hypothetical protein
VQWSRVQLGSNTVVGPTTSQTTVTVGGVELFGAQVSDDQRLLLSADLYVRRGRHLGAFVAHVWQSPRHDAELLTAPKRVVVRFRETYEVLLSVCVRDDELIVTALDLETRDGKRCVLDRWGRLAAWTPGPQLPVWQRDRACEMGLDRIDLAALISDHAVDADLLHGVTRRL